MVTRLLYNQVNPNFRQDDWKNSLSWCYAMILWARVGTTLCSQELAHKLTKTQWQLISLTDFSINSRNSLIQFKVVNRLHYSISGVHANWTAHSCVSFNKNCWKIKSLAQSWRSENYQRCSLKWGVTSAVSGSIITRQPIFPCDKHVSIIQSISTKQLTQLVPTLESLEGVAAVLSNGS